MSEAEPSSAGGCLAQVCLGLLATWAGAGLCVWLGGELGPGRAQALFSALGVIGVTSAGALSAVAGLVLAALGLARAAQALDARYARSRSHEGEEGARRASLWGLDYRFRIAPDEVELCVHDGLSVTSWLALFCLVAALASASAMPEVAAKITAGQLWAAMDEGAGLACLGFFPLLCLLGLWTLPSRLRLRLEARGPLLLTLYARLRPPRTLEYPRSTRLRLTQDPGLEHWRVELTLAEGAEEAEGGEGPVALPELYPFGGRWPPGEELLADLERLNAALAALGMPPEPPGAG